VTNVSPQTQLQEVLKVKVLSRIRPGSQYGSLPVCLLTILLESLLCIRMAICIMPISFRVPVWLLNNFAKNRYNSSEVYLVQTKSFSRIESEQMIDDPVYLWTNQILFLTKIEFDSEYSAWEIYSDELSYVIYYLSRRKCSPRVAVSS